jgi:1,3-beta-glucan synthase
MSGGYQQGGHQDYDDGYGQQRGQTDSYYQDDQGQYYDSNGQDAHGNQHGDGYYDESYGSLFYESASCRATGCGLT